MPKSDHLSKIRDAIDDFIGDDKPGTLKIDRPGKTDMVIITKEAFQSLVQAEARLNELEGGIEEDVDHDALIAALRSTSQ